MIYPVSDLSDPRLDPFRQLKQSNLTRGKDLLIAEGLKLVERLFASRFPVECVVCATDHLQQLTPFLRDEVPVYVISAAQVDELIGFEFHRGVLAAGRRLPALTVEEVLQRVTGRLTWTICPDVTDPENLGSLIRTSAAFGADAILLGPSCSDPFSRRVLRTSMGASLRLPVVQSIDLERDLIRLREAGIEIVGTVLDPTAESLSGVQRPERLGLMFGNEGTGLTPRWLTHCTRRWTIPMHSGVDSLNVALAAGIFLYRVLPPGE